MTKYIAANGQEITDAMIDKWCESYERGEFPKGEHSIGAVVVGRPPLSSEQTVTLNIKVPLGMKAALAKRAQSEGVSLSAYARGVLADSILAGVGA